MSLTPNPVVGFGERVTRIACGLYHTVILTESSRCFTYGLNDYGQLGQDMTDRLEQPELVPSLEGIAIRWIACGIFHTAAVDTEGRCLTWGMGSYGQLGHGDFASSSYPRAVPGLAPVDEVACGLYHTLSILQNGDAASWGWGEYGQLGHDDGEDSCDPRVIESLQGYKVLQAACGLYHTCALVEVPEWNQVGSLSRGGSSEGSRPPSSRLGHTLTTVGGKIYMFGGFTDDMESSNELYVYDRETEMWAKPNCTGKIPEGRNGHSEAMVKASGKIYFFGGLRKKAGKKVDLDELWCFDANENHWSEPACHGAGPDARNAHDSTTLGATLYVFGGCHESNCLNDLWALDTNTYTWSLVQTKGETPIPRERHTLTTVNDELVVFGGWSGQEALADLHVLDTETCEWIMPKLHGATQVQRRAGHRTIYDAQNFSLYFIGGWNVDSWVDKVEVLMLETMEWSKVPVRRAQPSQRHSHGCCADEDGTIYVFGGYGGRDGQTRLGDMYTLSIHHTKVTAWGWGGYGQLGIGKSDTKYSPEFVDIPNTQVVQISSGMFHCCALSDLGELFTWGLGMYGQLGHGHNSMEVRPRRVESLASHGRIVECACGPFQTMAIHENGTPMQWGWIKGPMVHGEATMRRVRGMLAATANIRATMNAQKRKAAACRSIQKAFRLYHATIARRRAQEEASRMIALRAQEFVVKKEYETIFGQSLSLDEYHRVKRSIVKLQALSRGFLARMKTIPARHAALEADGYGSVEERRRAKVEADRLAYITQLEIDIRDVHSARVIQREWLKRKARIAREARERELYMLTDEGKKEKERGAAESALLALAEEARLKKEAEEAEAAEAAAAKKRKGSGGDTLMDKKTQRQAELAAKQKKRQEDASARKKKVEEDDKSAKRKALDAKAAAKAKREEDELRKVQETQDKLDAKKKAAGSLAESALATGTVDEGTSQQERNAAKERLQKMHARREATLAADKKREDDAARALQEAREEAEAAEVRRAKQQRSAQEKMELAR